MGKKKRLSFEAKDAEKFSFAYRHSRLLTALALFAVATSALFSYVSRRLRRLKLNASRATMSIGICI